VQIPIKLPPKSSAHNACGIVRHSTLWLLRFRNAFRELLPGHDGFDSSESIRSSFKLTAEPSTTKLVLGGIE